MGPNAQALQARPGVLFQTSCCMCASLSVSEIRAGAHLQDPRCLGASLGGPPVASLDMTDEERQHLLDLLKGLPEPGAPAHAPVSSPLDRYAQLPVTTRAF